MKCSIPFLLLTVLLLALVFPALAQFPETPAPEGEEAISTPIVTPAPVQPAEESPQVVEVPVEVFKELTSTDRFISWTTIAYSLILAAVGGGSFAYMIGRIDKRGKDEIERNYHAMPPVWQKVILTLLGNAEAGVRFLREVTDGQPNDEPPDTTPGALG